MDKLSMTAADNEIEHLFRLIPDEYANKNSYKVTISWRTVIISLHVSQHSQPYNYIFVSNLNSSWPSDAIWRRNTYLGQHGLR